LLIGLGCITQGTESAFCLLLSKISLTYGELDLKREPGRRHLPAIPWVAILPPKKMTYKGMAKKQKQKNKRRINFLGLSKKWVKAFLCGGEGTGKLQEVT
jgi:hypothetical protein